MRSLGFAFQKGEVRFLALSGSKKAPTFIESGRFVFDPTAALPDLMNHVRSQVLAISTRIRPDVLAFRVFAKTASVSQLRSLHYPAAIISLYCFDHHLQVVEVGSQSITPKRLGLAPKTALLPEVDRRLGIHPPHWDDPQRYAALTAWYVLD